MKKKKSNNNLPSQKARLAHQLQAARLLIAAHALILLFILGGIAIGYSLVRARTYLNPQRDEAKYAEGAKSNNFSKIDQKIIDRLKLSQNYKDYQINAKLAPDRDNPFSE